MDNESDGNLSFEHGGGSLRVYPSSGNFMCLPAEEIPGMTISSEFICKSWNGLNSFFSGDWDSLVTLEENAEILTSPMASHDQIDISSYAGGILENQGISCISPLGQYSSDPNFVELVPDLSCFSNGSLLEMHNSLSLPKYCQIANSASPPDHLLEGDGTGSTLTSRNGADNCAQFGEKRGNLDKRIAELLPGGKKRKRVPDDQSQLVQSKNMETVQQKKKYLRQEDEMKQKTKQNPNADMEDEPISKEFKDCSQNGEASKEDYIHVRAKRGHATTSHSIAERLRRERITERMKYLQDIVPGCNKITGKAVMLDEIINYVQSLQRQVEFLSMKLATVYPEMNSDIEQILSKDIHHSQDGNAALPGFSPGMNSSYSPGMNSSYPIQQVTLKETFPTIQNLQSPIMPPMPSMRRDNELQSISGMGFISDPDLGNVEPNGNLGSEEPNGCMEVEP
ncbi:hypothetical protein L1049_024657 [Liquidambar formosana]|uniref:BHLH domain-containing protein n=1 Tax=Liquidambar formosana TaxID=63359 RepID=A0AAP0RWF1_LIQFO